MDNNNNFQQPQFDSQQPVQPQYDYNQQPVQYVQQPIVAQAQPAKPLAIVGMVCGIVSLVFCWFGTGAITGLLAGIAGIICSTLAKKKGNESGMVKAGIIMSIIGTILSGIFFIACTACVACAAAEGAFDSSYYYY